MKCAYCQREIKKGTGLMYVYRTGDVAFYDTNACFTSHVQMGRKINKKMIAGSIKSAKSAPAPEKKEMKAAATAAPTPQKK